MPVAPVYSYQDVTENYRAYQTFANREGPSYGKPLMRATRGEDYLGGF